MKPRLSDVRAPFAALAIGAALIGSVLLALSPSSSAQAPQPGVRMTPEGNTANVIPNIPAANLWLCEAATCTGLGEGALRVVQQAFGITEGLGAYELVMSFDATAISAINPCDIVFGEGGAGAQRGPVDEPDGSTANADCADGGEDGAGTCALTLPVEHLTVFGCATAGVVEGPTGTIPLASLVLVPSDLVRNNTIPHVGNGILTVVTNRTCELANVLGEPIAGSVGNVTPFCRDLAVTVRSLEADFDADCDVDTADAQAITSRYGALFGGGLYDRSYDLEPTGSDLDIDIKDVQRVYARLGSTCQAPIPRQPPMGPDIPFKG